MKHLQTYEERKNNWYIQQIEDFIRNEFKGKQISFSNFYQDEEYPWLIYDIKFPKRNYDSIISVVDKIPYENIEYTEHYDSVYSSIEITYDIASFNFQEYIRRHDISKFIAISDIWCDEMKSEYDYLLDSKELGLIENFSVKDRRDMAEIGLLDDEDVEVYLIEVRDTHFVCRYLSSYQMTWKKDYALQFDTEEEAEDLKNKLLDEYAFNGRPMKVVKYSEARDH